MLTVSTLSMSNMQHLYALLLLTSMNSEEDDNNQQDDGFESDKDDKLEEKDVEVEPTPDPLDNKMRDSQHVSSKDELPPGQAIIREGKKYSLFPDMATGWTPRDSKCHPIPITVDLPVLDKLYTLLFKPLPTVPTFQTQVLERRPFEMVICYFGPRYDNTYYSWYQMPFEFPYQNIEPPTNMKFTNRPFNGQHPTLHITQPNTLVFDSFFENGNLDCAVKVGDLEYDLYLRVDSNTRGHFQWYNFKVKNLQKGVKYKFNICNLQKEDSLYNRGMKPYLFSTKAKEKMDRGWVQDGQNIKYEKKPSRSLGVLYSAHNHSHNDYNCRLPYYYKLSFEYGPMYENDVIQMAYCVPYTFTNLREYLDLRRKKCENKKFYTQSRLCLSLGGLPVPLITINQETAIVQEEVRGQLALGLGLPGIQGQGANKFKKKCVVIGCRVHPGQSNSSYMMEGFIDFLCSNKSAAKTLRSKIQFKIVPMLNPDGVCFGNYRTGLSGKDFNREYVNPDVRIFPEVYCFKKLVVDYKKKYGANFLMFLDFHGHSVRKNVFMYGPQNSIMDKYYYESRIFPKIMSKRTEMFRYYSCVFKIQQEKKTTARSIFQQVLNIPLSFTIEASNGSYYNTSILKDFPFNAKMWIEMGTEIGNSLFEYLSIVIAAERARLQKYEKLAKYHNHGKEENNLRTSKLVERKRERKKGGQRVEDFNYGRVSDFQQEHEPDDDFFKYIYEKIEKNNDLKEDNERSQEIKKALQQQDNIKEGESDNQSQENDLEPQKLSLLYQAIKRKQCNQASLVKKQSKEQAASSQSPGRESPTFKNHFIHSRVRSALGSHQEQYCKKLAQPRKSGQAIVNLSFPEQDSNKGDSLQIMALKASKILEQSKKNPKTFQDFVSSYQKWQKNQRDQTRPASAFLKSTIIAQRSTLAQGRNYSTIKTTKKSLFMELRKSNRPSSSALQKSQRGNIKKYQSIQQRELTQSRAQIVRSFSPIKNRH